jgi:predicted nucleic acid-binding protein
MHSVLVDTSVWVEHLRNTSNELIALLEDDLVLCHPAVIGELACGHLRNRTQILQLMRQLPSASTASFEELLQFIDDVSLQGKELGWIDVQLLASARLSQGLLFSRDKALNRAATTLGLQYK